MPLPHQARQMGPRSYRPPGVRLARVVAL